MPQFKQSPASSFDYTLSFDNATPHASTNNKYVETLLFRVVLGGANELYSPSFLTTITRDRFSLSFSIHPSWIFYTGIRRDIIDVLLVTREKPICSFDKFIRTLCSQLLLYMRDSMELKASFLLGNAVDE